MAGPLAGNPSGRIVARPATSAPARGRPAEHGGRWRRRTGATGGPVGRGVLPRWYAHRCVAAPRPGCRTREGGRGGSRPSAHAPDPGGSWIVEPRTDRPGSAARGLGAGARAAAPGPAPAPPGPARTPWVHVLPSRCARRCPACSAPLPGMQRPPLPGSPRQMPPARTGFGLPNLRRNVCPHFYMTGPRGAIPIQAPHLLKGLLRQDAERLALPAPWRRAPRRGLRQRRVPHATVQPVRVLRGRADEGVTRGAAAGSPDAPDLSYAEALAAIEAARAVRHPPGPRSRRALLRAAGRPAAGRPRRARRRDQRQGLRHRAGRARACAPPATASGETPKPHLVTYRERIVVDGRPIDAGDVRAARRRRSCRWPTGSRRGSGRRRSSSS